MSDYEILQIPVEDIKFFVRRSRGETAYARLKQSIKEVGLKTPIGVREITDRTKSKRRRPSKNGLYNYELVYGQGRLQAFRDLDIPEIPAVIVDVSEQEIVGRFLAENTMRRKLSWREKAKLIKQDVDVNGLSLADVASRYCITISHAKKYLRVIDGASEKTLSRADAGVLDMNVTEKLTTIPKKDQDLVIEVLDEHELDKSAIMHLVDEANKMKKNNSGSDVTKSLLRKSISDINSQLKKMRARFRYKKLEYGLGPQNLFRLGEEEGLLDMLREKEIDFEYFNK